LSNPEVEKFFEKLPEDELRVLWDRLSDAMILVSPYCTRKDVKEACDVLAKLSEWNLALNLESDKRRRARGAPL